MKRSEKLVEIFYEPKLRYLNVHTRIAESHTKFHSEKFGLDLHKIIKDDRVSGFRLWDLRATLDVIKEVFPGFESAEFGDGVNLKVTNKHISSLLRAIFYITGDLEVKKLLDLIEDEERNAT